MPTLSLRPTLLRFACPVSVSLKMASVVATRRLAPLDWARHESTIRRLYVEDDMGLSALRNKMAKEFGFHAR